MVLDSDLDDVLLVLLLEDWQLSKSMTWNENRATRCEKSSILELYLDCILLGLKYNSLERAIRESDIITRSHSFGNIRVVDLDETMCVSS